MDTPGDSLLAHLAGAVVSVLRERGYERRAQPFRLSSGGESRDYVDARRALAAGDALALASRALVACTEAAGVDFDAAGGMTMGADPLAHGIAVITGKAWFSVRKEIKAHGAGRRIEGARLGPGTAALVLDDTVTTGGSLLQAVDAVEAEGARVALVTALLDRGEVVGRRLRERGLAYRPLATYRDLGIEAVNA